MVIALGKSGVLVGVIRYDDAAEVARLPGGGFHDPSPEVVMALRPDLVLWLTDGAAFAAAERIATLAIPVLPIQIVSVADILASPRLVGSAHGEASAGKRLAHTLAEPIETARGKASVRPRVQVLFMVGHEPLVVAGPGSCPDVPRIVGDENVANDCRSWPVRPLERAMGDESANRRGLAKSCPSMAAVFSPLRWTGRFALASGPAWPSHKGWPHPGLGAAPCRRFAEAPSPVAMVSATLPHRTNRRGRSSRLTRTGRLAVRMLRTGGNGQGEPLRVLDERARALGLLEPR